MEGAKRVKHITQENRWTPTKTYMTSVNPMEIKLRSQAPKTVVEARIINHCHGGLLEG